MLSAGHDLHHSPDPPVQSVRCLGRSGQNGTRLSRYQSFVASLPYLEQNGIYGQWDFTHGVAYNALENTLRLVSRRHGMVVRVVIVGAYIAQADVAVSGRKIMR